MDESRPAHSASQRTALVTGAGGFLAGFIIAALRERGWRVLRGVRSPQVVNEDQRHCDFERLPTPRHWASVLDGVDAVVNVAGILRETGQRRFDTIHHDAPLALARACVERGVRRFVQISALGHASDGAFVTSKHRFDAALVVRAGLAGVHRRNRDFLVDGDEAGVMAHRLRACRRIPGQ